MSKKKTLFSVGPWEANIETRTDNDFICVIDALGHLVVSAADSVEPVELDKANARLIACAPEMYDLLHKIFTEAYDTLDETGDAVIAIPDDVFSGIVPILKKARGEKNEQQPKRIREAGQ